MPAQGLAPPRDNTLGVGRKDCRFKEAYIADTYGNLEGEKVITDALIIKKEAEIASELTEEPAAYYFIDTGKGILARKSLENVQKEIGDRNVQGLPIGTIIQFDGTIPPPGYLIYNNGAIHGRTTYPEFWQFIQDQKRVIPESEWQALKISQSSVGYYGDGDGVNIFRMPYIVDFFRPSSEEREPGSWQGDAIRDIVGTGAVSDTYGKEPQVSGAFKPDVNGTANTGLLTASSLLSFKASRVVPTADENRSKNIATLYCIKVFDAPVDQGTVVVSELANDVARLSGEINNVRLAASGAGMPSTNYVDFTLPANLTGFYTAPADGFVFVCRHGTSPNTVVYIASNSPDNLPSNPWGSSVFQGMRSLNNSGNGSAVFGFVPVKRGDKTRFYVDGSDPIVAQFIYAAGVI